MQSPDKLKINKQIKLYNDNCKTNLFLMDIGRRVLIRTNKQEFQNAKGSVVKINGFIIKVLNGSRSQLSEFKPIFYTLNKYEAEGLLGTIGMLFSGTTKIASIAYKVVRQESDVETNAMFLDAMSLLLQHSSQTYNNWTPSYFVGFLARVYSLFTRARKYASESLDSTLLLAGAIGLPDAFFGVLKKLNILTNKKIGDHPGLFLEGIQMISTYLSRLIKRVSWLPESVKNIFDKFFTFGDLQLQVIEMQNSLNKWKNDKKILADPLFRKNVFEQKENLDKHPDIAEKLRVGVNFKMFYNEFSKMVTSGKAFEKCSRQEPVLIVLEGPPGVRKTVAVLKIIKLLNLSVYTHIVKSVEDGKDFYDGYNNEDVFVMDDVGQQGVSQWRTIINMVSSVRMPLECASVDLKDTKYFDSKIIIVTTNNFSNLVGLTKSDGISDIKALWRRAQVFKFVNESKILFSRFDVRKDEWTSTALFNNNKEIKSFVGDNLEISIFITAYIKKCLNYLSEVSVDIDLTSSQVQIAQERVEELLTEYYDAQGWTSATMTILSSWTYIRQFLEDFVQAIYNYIIENATNVYCWVAGVGVYLTYKMYCEYCNIDSIRNEDSNLNIVNEWTKVTHSKGIIVEIKDNKVYSSESSYGTLVDSIQKQVKIIKILLRNNSFEISHCLVSGSKIILPAHVIYDHNNTLILYNCQQDFVNEVRALDHCQFEVLFEDRVNDVAILQVPLLNLTPYKNISNYFKFKNKVARNPYFVWSGEPVKLEGTYVPSEVLPKYITRYGEVVVTEPLTYQMSSKGFCGSVIVDENAGVVGFHVAGDGELGISKIFSQSLVAKIHGYLEADYQQKIILDDKPLENFSGMIAKSDKISDGPKKTHLKLSSMAELHEPTKAPANLRALGEHTVKLRAKRVHKPVSTIMNEELKYMEDFLLFILPNFSPITEREVIKGNEDIAPINKDSVSGMDFPLDKREYFDFELGECKEEFKNSLEEYRLQCLSGYPDKITQHHTLKDELRIYSKVEKPRTFGVDSLLTQFEMKRLMGNLMKELKKERWNNGLAIGINPYADWPKLYSKFVNCLLCWDADIGEYDASVSPQIQNLLNKVLLKKFVGTDRDRIILTRVLQLVIQSWVVAGNKLFYKTHGVLSGMWITNLFNSIYNRCYTAGWYYRQTVKHSGKANSISKFLNEVVEFVQGDDKICGVKTNPEWYNAITMRDYFNSCGMTFTDGDKGAIESLGKSIHECTFLKRKFAFHDEIGDIVGPLSLESITNSIRWYKDDNDEKEILKDKYHVYQRELYLHGKLGEEMMEKAKKFIKDNNLKLESLSKEYLRKTYIDDPEYWYNYTQKIQDKHF